MHFEDTNTGVKRSRVISNFKMYMCVCVCVCVLVAQSCLTLCDPMDCSPPGSFVHGILQAKLLEWVAISFSSICIYLYTY